MKSAYLPRARKDGFQIQIVSEETVLYDTSSDRASVLNPTAAFVWHNADGTRSVSDIADAMSDSFKTPIDQRVVWYALEQLSSKSLLQERAPVPAQYAHLTRRDVLTKAGLVGAAFAIPVVVTMIAPSPAQAQSCAGGLPLGSICVSGTQCCSGCCAGALAPVCSPQSSCA